MVTIASTAIRCDSADCQRRRSGRLRGTVGAYQDLNGGRLDATVARNPTEPLSISNNPRPKDRSPTWDEAKFTLPPEGPKMVIELR